MIETYIDGFHRKDDVEKLKYNRLGNTGMNVSMLGLGKLILKNLHPQF